MMGIFGQSSPFDVDVEKATSETNTNDNWSYILDVCDKVTTNPRSAKDCLKSIMKRMGHPDPHVVMQAITLLDACANNCGKPFHLEIASRDFETEFRRLLSKAQPKVSLKMRQMLKNWAENDFKNDAELNLIPSFYTKLRSEGFDFSNFNDKSDKLAAKANFQKDPNVIGSRQEEDDIAKAIELSLKESKNKTKQNNNSAMGTSSEKEKSAYPSLYPSFGGGNVTGSVDSATSGNFGTSRAQPEPRKVRALYDFEAAEENELTFFASEIIHVIDDSDANWWRGYNQRGEGLFPSNFVTADLSVDLDRLDVSQQQNSRKNVEINAVDKKVDNAENASQPVEIDEIKIDRALYLLHEANPEDPSQDSEEMLHIEQLVHRMGPMIDAELERVDRKHAQLTQLSSDLVDAINLYHSLMRDDHSTQFNAMAGVGYMVSVPVLTYNNQALYSANNSHFPLGQLQNFKSGIQQTANSECASENGSNYIITANQVQQQLTTQLRHEQSSQLNTPHHDLLTHGQPNPTTQTQIFQQQQYPQTSIAQQPVAPVISTTSNQTSVAMPPQPFTPFMTSQHQQQQQNHVPYLLSRQTNSTQFTSVLPNEEHNFRSLSSLNSHESNASNQHSIDQFNPLQQQMAALSMSISHPVASIPMPSSSLPQVVPQQSQQVSQMVMQNDSIKANIPIYQQQR